MSRHALCLSVLALTACSGATGQPTDAADVPVADATPADLIEEWDWGFVDTADSEIPRPVEPTISLIAPAVVLADRPFPVVVRVTVDGEPAFQLTTPAVVSSDGTEAATLALYRGTGSAEVVTPTGSVTLAIEVASGKTERTVTGVAPNPDRELAGELAGDELVWGPDEVMHITDDVSVAAGSTLTIHAGTTVLLDAKVNLLVDGEIVGEGTPAAPLYFAPWDADKPWGGLRVADGSGTFSYTFFTHGGGDGSKVFGHSGSQAVLFVEEGSLDLDNVFILDNVGKGLGSQLATMTVTDSVISRCDTGGELKKTLVGFHRTWFLEMPSADGEPVDDDNDCIYLHNPPPGLAADEPSATLTECVFAVGKDDGIDHNGSRIRVLDSFIEEFHHEGIACSKDNWVEVTNTLVRGCQQGIEAGYGSPQVTVDHCTIVENEVGFRLGDSYERVVSGSLTVTNSIAVQNSNGNVWNFSRRDQGPLLDHVNISNSLVDSPEWDSTNENLPGLPAFDSTWHLLPGSIGVGAASDGLDVGIL